MTSPFKNIVSAILAEFIAKSEVSAEKALIIGCNFWSFSSTDRTKSTGEICFETNNS